MPLPGIIVVDGDHVTVSRIGRIADAMHVPIESFATAEELLGSSACDHNGVVVCEFRLLGCNGIDMQQRLRKLNPHIQIVFLTAFAETWLTVLAMQNGAYTVIDKPGGEQQLWDAIRMAMDRYRTAITQQHANDQLLDDIGQLNQRQRDVLEMMLEGLPNKLVAERLHISIRTVESCRHAVFEQTGTGSLAELVRRVTLARLHAPDPLIDQNLDIKNRM
ncbi:MAG: response regulator transcription factor [Pirellulaceae bacterium]